MPFSFHTHSGEFCNHASGSLEEVVLRAIELKFDTIGLTEHVPRFEQEFLYPEEVKPSIC
jgi:histidinol-phosphatase (PHP family)